MKKNIYVVLLVILTVIVIGFTIFNSLNKKETKEEKIEIVTNYTEFYTVDSCANRFVNNIMIQDKDSMMKQLNKNYIDENNVTIDNIFDYIEEINATNYKTKTVYYEKINDNVTKYYVKGILIKENFDDNMNVVSDTQLDYYLIIYIDNDSDTFSVEPYDGKLFLEE